MIVNEMGPASGVEQGFSLLPYSLDKSCAAHYLYDQMTIASHKCSDVRFCSIDQPTLTKVLRDSSEHFKLEVLTVWPANLDRGGKADE